MLSDSFVKAQKYLTEDDCDAVDMFLPAEYAYLKLQIDGYYYLLAEHHEGGFKGWVTIPPLTKITTKEFATMMTDFFNITGTHYNVNLSFIHEDTLITNPYLSEDLRDVVSPLEYYDRKDFFYWVGQVVTFWQDKNPNCEMEVVVE